MQYAIKDACDVYLLDRSTKKPVLFSDYANSTNLTFTSERTFARARGVNKIAFDHSREGTFTVDFEVFDLAWISILLGATDEKETRDFIKREVLTVGEDNTVMLSNEPKDGSLAIFILDRDKRTHLKEQVLDEVSLEGTPEENGYIIDEVDPKKLTFNSTSCPEGTNIVAYYMLDYENPVRTFRIKSDKFSSNFIILGKTEVKNEFGELEFMDLKIPNCSPKSDMEITLTTDNVTTVSAEFDLMADENNEMAIISIID